MSETWYDSGVMDWHDAQDALGDAWGRDRRAVIDEMAREVCPTQWAEGGSMRYRGHTITWGEYVQRRHEIEDEEAWPEDRADAIGQNGGEGLHYAEDSDYEAPLAQAMREQRADAEAKWRRVDMSARSKYHREITPGVWVDVYAVLAAWDVRNPALQHLIKKALQAGQRGYKTLDEDMDDIVASAERAQELES